MSIGTFNNSGILRRISPLRHTWTKKEAGTILPLSGKRVPACAFMGYMIVEGYSWVISCFVKPV